MAGWTEAYSEKQAGMPALLGQLQQKQQAQEQEKSSRGGGLLGLLGGAIAMLIPGGQVAGIGMMAGGLGRMIGG